MPRQDRLSYELGSPLEEGWTNSTTVAWTGAGAHKDAMGFGGNGYGGNGGFGELEPESRDFKDGPTAEIKARAYINVSTVNNDSEARLRWLGTDQSILGSVRYKSSTDQLTLYTGAGTLVATSASSLLPSVWHRIEVHVFIDGVTGFIKVYVDDDGTYSTPFVEFTGDTLPAAVTQIERIRMFNRSFASLDDIAINTIGVRYDTGVGGVPVVGETITNSGQTALIESVNGDAVSGFLIISSVSGAFVDNTQLLSSGTFDALIDAPSADYVDGLMPHSDFPGDGLIVYEPASANGTTSGLTGDDGNSVDNYLRVDDLPINTTNENVAGGVNLLFDSYGKGTLPASAVEVKAVETVHSSQKDGTTINNARHVLRFGGVDYTPADSEYALPNDWQTDIHTWDTKPDGTGAFSVADVDAVGTEPGFQVRT